MMTRNKCIVLFGILMMGLSVTATPLKTIILQNTAAVETLTADLTGFSCTGPNTIINQSDMPYDITAPGTYVLGGDLTGQITIGSNNVVLNLGSFDISNSGSSAIVVNNGVSAVTIIGGSIGNNGGALTGIDLSAGDATNIVISNCAINNCSSMIGSGSGISANNVSGLLVSNSNFGSDYYGINLYGSLTQDVVIDGCAGYGSLATGINIASAGSSMVGGIVVNNCVFTGGQNGFYVGSSYDVTLRNCVGASNGYAGFNTSTNFQLSFINCSADRNPIGFQSASETNLVMQGCVVSGTTTSNGFYLTGCTDATLTGCTSTGCAANGFYIGTSPTKNTCQDCVAVGNGSYGFFWDGTGSNVLFLRNSSSGNTTGNYNTLIINTAAPGDANGFTNADASLVDSTIYPAEGFLTGVITISTSGTYVVQNVSSVRQISINASNVTVDLNGCNVNARSNTPIIISSSVSGIVIKNGTVNLNGSAVPNYGIDMTASGITDVVIENLTMYGCQVGIGATNAPQNLTVRNCTFVACQNSGVGAGISVTNGQGIVISGCSFIDNDNGIYVIGPSTEDVVIADCNGCITQPLSDAANPIGISCVGLAIASGTGVTVVKDCNFSGMYNGLYAASDGSGNACFEVVIENCVMDGSISSGFNIQNLNDSKIVGCSARDNAGQGFAIETGTNLFVGNCNAADNGSYGFSVDYSSSDTSANILVQGCTALGNPTGFFAGTSGSIRFYQNIGLGNGTNFDPTVTNAAVVTSPTGMNQLSNIDGSGTF